MILPDAVTLLTSRSLGKDEVTPVRLEPSPLKEDAVIIPDAFILLTSMDAYSFVEFVEVISILYFHSKRRKGYILIGWSFAPPLFFLIL